MSEIDSIDRRILDLLQQDGRLTMTELGERVGLSTSPCSQRVKRLEAQGVIKGYHARVNPAALGKNLLVFVEITLAQKSEHIFKKVRDELQNMPEVLECHLISGSFDYLAGDDFRIDRSLLKEFGQFRRNHFLYCRSGLRGDQLHLGL